MKFSHKIAFLLILAIILISGCNTTKLPKPDNGNTGNIIPAPVGVISNEDLALLQVNEQECNTGEDFAPKVKYTWKWSEISPDFCEKYYCDATQFSIVLLKKLNAIIEKKQFENLEFEALLMRDGFSGSFQKDFDKYMREKNFLDTPSFYTDGKIGEIFADKDKFVFSASEIGRPGKYKIKVNPQKNLSDGVIIEFELISSEGIENPFYYFPFNGEIGENRKEYGLGYTLEEELTVSDGLTINKKSSVTGKFIATVKKIEDYGYSNAPATRGTVLKLSANPLGSERSIDFSPTLATPVLLHSKANTENANTIALLYRVTENEKTEIAPGNSFLTWQPLETCKSYNNSTSPFLDARNTKEPQAYMIFNDPSSLTKKKGDVYYRSSDVFYKSIIYTPRQVTLSSIGAYIDSKQDKQATLEFTTPISKAKTVALNGAPKIFHNNPNDMIQNFEQIFESIKNKEMCIQKTGDAENLEAKIYWNEEKLYERIGTQIDVAQQQCLHLREDHGHSEGNIIPNANLGEQKAVVVLIKFLDTDSTQYASSEEIKNLIFSDENPSSLNNFVKEVSYNRAWLSGDVYGWYTAPITTAESCDGEKGRDIYQNAIQFVDGIINFQDYKRLIIILPALDKHQQCDLNPNGGGSTGFQEFKTQDGLVNLSQLVARSYHKSEVDVLPSFDTLTHELGHNFGVKHANFWDCQDTTIGENCESIEYGDYYDTMGTGEGHYNVIYKEKIGWLDSSNLLEVTKKYGIYRIEALETSSDGIKALKIPVSNGFPYYLEYRRPIGFDKNNYNFEEKNLYDVYDGVIVRIKVPHSYGTSIHETSQLLDMTPLGESKNDTHSILKVGKIFHDSANGIKITPLSLTNDYIEVEISLSEFN